jgi:hypothetical protein
MRASLLLLVGCVAVALAGCAGLAPVTSGSSGLPAAASGAPVEATKAPSLMPPASAAPGSPVLGTITVPGGTEPMIVTLVGDSTVVVRWRAATEADLVQHAGGVPDSDISLVALGPSELLLAWAGGACDLSATLTVQRTSLALVEDPRHACDAVGITKGVVLSFASHTDPGTIEISLKRAAILP